MFLLNQNKYKIVYSANGFTSHYVPIKSNILEANEYFLKSFTSHYVPIKSQVAGDTSMLQESLHPIMFLLNHFCL